MNKKIFSRNLLQSVIAGVLFTSFGVSSCSSEDGMEFNMPSTHKLTTYKLTPQEALDNAKPFLASLETQKGLSRKIMAYKFASKTIKNTRVVYSEDNSSAVSAKEKDTLLYVLNLNGGGYIVAPTDSRITPVLAYIQEGEYDPNDTTNTGFNMFLGKTKQMIQAEKEIVDGTKKENSNTSNINEADINKLQLYIPEEPKQTTAASDWTVVSEVPKRLKSTLGQEFPLNKYIWNGYAGCVAVATIQTMMYKKLPKYIANFEGIEKIPLDWDKMENTKQIMRNHRLSEDIREQLALLTSYINARLKANIKKDGTGANTKDAVDLLNSLGISAAKLRRMNETDVITCLNEGGVLLSCGYMHSVKFLGKILKYKGGHAWVVDGYKQVKRGNQQKLYVHCNWGWSGLGNGVYLWNCFYSDSPETTLDNPRKPTNEVHFKYNFKYSHVK